MGKTVVDPLITMESAAAARPPIKVTKAMPKIIFLTILIIFCSSLILF
jgi:hypothetical protein